MQEKLADVLTEMVDRLPPPPEAVMTASAVQRYLDDPSIDDVALASGQLSLLDCIRWLHMPTSIFHCGQLSNHYDYRSLLPVMNSQVPACIAAQLEM